MNATPNGWEGLLAPGETILWQGRPSGQVTFAGLDARRTIFGLFFLGFALFWTFGAVSHTGEAPTPARLLFPLFGLLFIYQGAKLAGGDRIWQAYERRHSWYTLTSERAFIATELFGRRNLRSWPITSTTILDYEDGRTGSVFFADRSGSFARGRRIGFEFIDDGREVLDLMRRVQRGTI